MAYLTQACMDTTPHPSNPAIVMTTWAVPATASITSLEKPITFEPTNDIMEYDAYLQPALEATTPHSYTPLKNTVTGTQGCVSKVPTDINLAPVAMDIRPHLITLEPNTQARRIRKDRYVHVCTCTCMPDQSRAKFSELD